MGSWIRSWVSAPVDVTPAPTDPAPVVDPPPVLDPVVDPTPVLEPVGGVVDPVVGPCAG